MIRVRAAWVVGAARALRQSAGDVRGLRARAGEAEWLDAADVSGRDVASNLAEIAATNRALGWTALMVGYVAPLAATLPRHRPLAVLDVATGGADVPRALVTWARRRGLPLTVTAVDRNPRVLEVARSASAGFPEISLVEADALALPFADGAFDVALCSLALHHFEPGAAVDVLRGLARVARAGIVVADLERSMLGYAGARALTLLWRSPLTRHDGPLSVRRSYTHEEARDLLRRAGLAHGTVTRHFPCRLVLQARRAPRPGEPLSSGAS
jgi:2-polyprenyl-3-methyl-5-hydroxy-6-metoxy-1,4-benzoquinol methylase